MMSRKRKSNKKTASPPKSTQFKIFIYESEYDKIREWTSKFPNLETGGDLFGLWSDDRTAVVQLVLGPGKQCKRTAVSFYQDVDYLDRVGNHLTTKEGLCHIGEWHSHHKLGLTRPSGGDENTIWSNMHRYGINRFCLFITTIHSNWSQNEAAEGVRVNGYLFEIDRESGRENQILSSNFEHMKKNSPFRMTNRKLIYEGAEDLTQKSQRSKSLTDYQSPKTQQKRGIQNFAIRESDNDDQPHVSEHYFWRFWKRIHSCLCVYCIMCK